MNILVTAGNTFVPIDRVRGITNIFTGRTGASIALACCREHAVTLLTSHPDLTPTGTERLTIRSYRLFDELEQEMKQSLRTPVDVVIHCAAVSDYRTLGVYAPDDKTRFDPERRAWQTKGAVAPTMIDRQAGKIKSDEPELWLRLGRTPKLVDRIRSDWRFRGVLVKFKLEVDLGDDDLLTVAERSRCQSDADLMVANTLDGAAEWAFLGPVCGAYQRVSRPDLPARLLNEIERLHKERRRG